MCEKDACWISQGKQRTAIIKVLNADLPKTPTEIMKECRLYREGQHVSRSNVSGHLRQFEKKELAYCLNPEAKAGKAFILTENGDKARNLVILKEKLFKEKQNGNTTD